MIQVDLSAAEIPIEPGGTAQLTVTVLNRQQHDDHISLELEGIDVEWYALPVPSLVVPAGQSQTARVLFRTGRTSDSRAATYPFLVRARGMESGEAGVQQGALVVKPFSALQVELSPKRVAATFFRHAIMLDVVVTNLGNRDETLDLYASDPEDACAYEFESDRITVKPGHSETVHLYVEPVTRPVLGAMRLYGFSVTARSIEDSYLSASAHGQVERRALLSTLSAALLLVVLLVAGVWAALRPHPVLVRGFGANPVQVMAGDPVVLSWDIANLGEGSYIDPGHLPVKGQIGTVEVRPPQSTMYLLVARGGGRELRRTAAVEVRPKPAAPRPRILEFGAVVGTTAGQERGRKVVRIHQGDPVTLTWRLKDAVGIVLNPLGPVVRDARIYVSDTVRPDATTTYVLAAQGAGGQVTTASVTVQVVPPTESIADIVSFRARPAEIVVGRASRLTWRVENAASIEIDNGVGGGLNPSGEFEVQPQSTTTYTLRATDSKGNLRTKQLMITVTPAPPPAPTDETAPPTGGAPTTSPPAAP